MLEHVFHVAPRAVKIFVERGGGEAFAGFAGKACARQVGHEEARIVAASHDFSLADHAPGPAPALEGLILKIFEPPRAGRASQTAAGAGGGERGRDFGQQTRVGREAKAIMHGVRFAPGQRCFAGEGAVAAHDDPRAAAPFPNGRDHRRERGDYAVKAGGGGARTQRRPQRHAADEGVERQQAVAIVVGVEVAAGLAAVHQMPHRIEINHQFGGVLVQTAHTQFQQGGCDGVGIVMDFVVAVGGLMPQFQPVERGRTREGHAVSVRVEPVIAQRVEFVAGHGQERIVAERVVIIEIGVTQRAAVEPLGQQVRQ